jgi:hypothetical protein
MGFPCSFRGIRCGVLYMVIDLATVVKYYIFGMGLVSLLFSKQFAERIDKGWQKKFGVKTNIVFSRIMFIIGGLIFIIVSILGLLGYIRL